MCGKRLVAVLRHQLPVLRKFGELSLDPQVRAELQRISTDAIDRLLRAEKCKLQLRGRSHTKPSTRLLHQIPIRPLTEWQDATSPVRWAPTCLTTSLQLDRNVGLEPDTIGGSYEQPTVANRPEWAYRE